MYNNGLSAGSYTVVITDSLGCSSDSTFVVNGPTPLTTTSTVTDVTCNGLNDGAVDVTITAGNPTYTYQWDNGATTEDIMDLTAETYRLTVIDGDGCKTYASYTVIEPEVLDATLITVDPNSSALGSIDLNVNGGTPSSLRLEYSRNDRRHHWINCRILRSNSNRCKRMLCSDRHGFRKHFFE